MTINLRKLGCAAVGGGLFLGGVYLGRNLTKENIAKNIEKTLYGCVETEDEMLTVNDYYKELGLPLLNPDFIQCDYHQLKGESNEK